MTNADTNSHLNPDPALFSAEAFVKKQLQDRLEAVALELEALAARVRAEAGSLERVGQPGVKSYVGVIGAIAADVTDRTAQLRIDRLASSAVDADIDRALRAAASSPTE